MAASRLDPRRPRRRHRSRGRSGSEGESLRWDGDDNFGHWGSWLRALVQGLLLPRGYTITGELAWWGSDPDARGTVRVEDGRVVEGTAPDVIESWAAMITGDDDRQRTFAKRMLMFSRDEALPIAREALERALHDPRPDVVAAARFALEKSLDRLAERRGQGEKA